MVPFSLKISELTLKILFEAFDFNISRVHNFVSMVGSDSIRVPRNVMFEWLYVGIKSIILKVPILI